MEMKINYSILGETIRMRIARVSNWNTSLDLGIFKVTVIRPFHITFKESLKKPKINLERKF